MVTLTVFANFYINSDETFQRMKDSFESFKGITAQKWVINARGAFKAETMAFLRERLGDKLVSYELQSKEGWFHDTQQMLKDIDTDFVLLWLEDHINLADVRKYDAILAEMKENGSEYLSYSWWNGGEPLDVYRDVPKKESQHIFSFTLDKKNLAEVEKRHSTFIIGMVSIFSTELFKKLLTETKMFMRQYPKYTPFNLEKGGAETKWLPVRYAIAKEELFCSIDAGKEGYSLQSRGLYPKREIRKRPLADLNLHLKQPSIFKKVAPKSLYDMTIGCIIFFNKVKKYLYLLSKGA